MKEEKNPRVFESETLALPPLKMILLENDERTRSSKKRNLSRDSQVTEAIVMRIIDRLNKKD